MKKIAIITPGFSGSTFPLEKRLAQKNFIVDHYQIVFQHVDEFESFPFKFDCNRFGSRKIERDEARALYQFIDNDNFSLNVLNFPRPFISVPILGKIILFVSKVILNKFAKKINTANYDCVLFIGQYSNRFFPFLLRKIKTNKIVALHEVCNHRNENCKILSPLLKEIKKQGIPIIVFSKNSYDYLCKYDFVIQSKIHLIHFGLFEGYLIYAAENKMNLPSQYVLYIGSISSHKGLDLLYESVSMQKWPCKFVVAGCGRSEFVEKMKGDERFFVINRFLKNREFAELIRKCKFVVCPYKTMSQSGIPQTAFLFGKPVVASNLEGFKEIIRDNENGLLFESGKKDALRDSLISMLNQDSVYRNIKKYVEACFMNECSPYSWNYIAEKYVELLTKIDYE